MDNRAADPHTGDVPAVLNSVQYLRAVAALAVVVFHAGERTGLHVTIGAAGVDIFFVISGFVMYLTSTRRPVTPGRFMLDRIKRIVPLYWIATGVMIAGAWVGLFPNLVLEPVHALASLFFIPMQSPSSGEVWPVLVQGWTLNYEMFFYLIFAASLFCPPRWRLVFPLGILAALVTAGALAAPAGPIGLTYTQPILLEFAAGMLMAACWLKGWIPRWHTGLFLALAGLAGFALIFAFGLGFDARICGPLATMLVFGAITLETHGKMPRLPGLTYLGNASYSIYLWHTFAVSVLVKIAGATGLPPLPSFLLAIAGGAVAGIISYQIIERPLNARLNAVLKDRRAIAFQPRARTRAPIENQQI